MYGIPNPTRNIVFASVAAGLNTNVASNDSDGSIGPIDPDACITTPASVADVDPVSHTFTPGWLASDSAYAAEPPIVCHPSSPSVAELIDEPMNSSVITANVFGSGRIPVAAPYESTIDSCDPGSTVTIQVIGRTP